MEITKYKEINKNSLQGTFTLKIPKWGDFLIHEMTYFKKDSNRWVSFPSRGYEKDGEKKYYSYCFFEDPAVLKSFSNKVLAALDIYFETHKAEMQIPSSRNNEEIPF
jgi:hypothetical protein